MGASEVADRACSAGTGRQRDHEVSLDAIYRLTGAAWVLAWDASGRTLASPGWEPSSAEMADGRMALEGIDEPTALDPASSGARALFSSCPDPGAGFLYIPAREAAAGAGVLLGFADGRTVTPGLDLAALGELIALAARPRLDEGSLTDVARLATAGRMAAGFAHEVGTPLNIISGYAEYLLMSAAPDSPVRKGLSTILDQTRRIALTIHQMVETARAPRGQPRQQQLLEKFTSEVLHTSSYILRKAEVKGQIEEQGASGGVVVGDLLRLNQALFNILSSAARLVGPSGRLSLRPVQDRAWGAGIELAGINASGMEVDLSPLLRPSPDDTSEYLGMLLAGNILSERGGGLHLVAAGEESGAPRLLVGLGGDGAQASENGGGGALG